MNNLYKQGLTFNRNIVECKVELDQFTDFFSAV